MRSAILALVLLPGSLAAAPPAPAHGGQVAVAGDHAFEVVFDDQGLHVMPRSALPEGGELRARVTLRARRQKPVEAALEVMRKPDGSVDHLMLSRDFSDVPDGSRKASFRIDGLGPETAKFSLVLRRPPPGSRSMGGSHGKAGSDHAMAGSHSDEPKAGSGHSMAGSHSDHGSAPRAKLLDVRDEAIAKAQRADYPLDHCLVSGDKLGADGPPVEVVVEGQLFRVCCEHCVEEIRGEPKKYLAKLEAARKQVSQGKASHSGGHHDHDHHDHDH
jgi:hypothetical protein